MTRPRIGVFGAGAIGIYLGVRLSAAGYPVTLIGRQRLVAAAADLTAVTLDGAEVGAADDLVVSTDAAALARCDLCLVTVKSADSRAAGAALATALDPGATVFSLQNGLGNVDRLRTGGLQHTALAGLVTFNVRRSDAARVIQATDGPILIERSSLTREEPARRLEEALSAAGEPAHVRDDLLAVQTAKLLLNLNNGLCAATGLPIRAALLAPDVRWCFATCIAEGLRVMRAAGLPVARIGRLSPPLIARLLKLPTFILQRVAGAFMRIDPTARSSTLQDLDAGKKT
ncbi:MAG: 2-dehydropantoate 2-reductase, partial [Myxococcota bacterium]